MLQNFILSGPIASGKTKVLSNILEKIIKQVPCYGFTEKCIHKNNSRIGYDVHTNLNGIKNQYPFVRLKERISMDGNIFNFDQDTIKLIENQFSKFTPKIQKPSLIYFDEFGKLESNYRGLNKAMNILLDKFESQRIPYVTLFAARKQNINGIHKTMQKFLSNSQKETIIEIPLKISEEDLIQTILSPLK